MWGPAIYRDAVSEIRRDVSRLDLGRRDDSNLDLGRRASLVVEVFF